jgi:hypothetical protein
MIVSGLVVGQNHQGVPMPTVSDQFASRLLDHVRRELDGSRFFSALSSGTAGIREVRSMFGQYYLWRNQFHRWFGVCIVRSPAFGLESGTSLILSELVEHIQVELDEDHFGLATTFLSALGVEPMSLTATPETIRYCDSFAARYLDPRVPAEHGLAALAGREAVSAERNRRTIEALRGHYGITSGLEFLDLHLGLEDDHLEMLLKALERGYRVILTDLEKPALEEISRHVRFWDEIYDVFSTGDT